jgi:ribulose-5-phosphate 4-epimerase/fuculose-1-phosphate aldolase
MRGNERNVIMTDIPKRFEKEIAELSAVSQQLGQLGYVASHGGNISARVDEDIVLITPTKVPKRAVRPEDVCAVNMKGEAIYCPPGHKPTGETPIHVGLFGKRADINALVHAHPPILTGFACAEKGHLLSRPILPEPITEVGPAAILEYAEPLTDELAATFDAHLGRHDFFLMKNHGCLVMSREGLERALDFLIMLEKQALTVLVAELLGGMREMKREDVENLDKTCKTRNLPFPGAPGIVKSLVELYF